MRIAVFGDIHGHWIDFQDTVSRIHDNAPLDIVLQCGDAQPFRDEQDLEYMHCPKKYRKQGDFRLFHEGKEEFPAPLLFIGGNHEPWNYLDENHGHGTLAPNIEFLGRVGMREIGGVRIAGLSGVYSPNYFDAPHLQVPYRVEKRKQATYYNNFDIDKALRFTNVDILLLHEWPDLMNHAKNESWPSHWQSVGSEQLSLLVDLLNPHWCFCAHMHYPAEYKYGKTNFICLSDFHRDPQNAYVVLDIEQETYNWPENSRIRNVCDKIA